MWYDMDRGAVLEKWYGGHDSWCVAVCRSVLQHMNESLDTYDHATINVQWESTLEMCSGGHDL